jgi:hypothetical protein
MSIKSAIKKVQDAFKPKETPEQMPEQIPEAKAVIIETSIPQLKKKGTLEEELLSFLSNKRKGEEWMRTHVFFKEYFGKDFNTRAIAKLVRNELTRLQAERKIEVRDNYHQGLNSPYSVDSGLTQYRTLDSFNFEIKIITLP